MTCALVDIRSGNLHSVENALRAAGAGDVTITADPDRIANADRVVLPGVGAFGACAASLRAIDGMEEALREAAIGPAARPFLGICVGMQLLADAGEEGCEGDGPAHRGLGLIPGRVRRLAPADGARVPHMGWNDVRPSRPHPLLVPGEAYFLHSFAFVGDGAGNDTAVLATSDHGGPVTAAIGRDTLVGVQFHPEKSQHYGLALLSRFLDWRP